MLGIRIRLPELRKGETNPFLLLPFLQHSLLFLSLLPARAIKSLSLSLRDQAILPRLASPQGREMDRERPFTSRAIPVRSVYPNIVWET